MSKLKVTWDLNKLDKSVYEDLQNKALSVFDKTSFEQLRGVVCECLIDQRKYIGEDPVGHCCYNMATTKIGSDEACVFVCDSCKEAILNADIHVEYSLRPLK